MEKEIANKKLTITLNDDMLKCAKEKGYKLPAVSISHYYGNTGIFTIEYRNGKEYHHNLDIYDKNTEKWIATYSGAYPNE